MSNKFYINGNYREIGYKNPDSPYFKRNVFLSPDDAVDKLYDLNDKGNNVYMSVYGYHETVQSSKDIVDNNIVFDRLVYDFDIDDKDDAVLLSLNGYNSVELKDMSDDTISSIANNIRTKESEDVSKCPDDDAVMDYYYRKYEHDYLIRPIKECQKVARWFKDKFNVDGLMFFSGGKGCHLHIIFNNPVEVRNVKEVISFIGNNLKKFLKLKTIDSSVYKDKVRVLRMPTSRHQGTKLYANPFLMKDSYLDILDKAVIKTDISSINIPDNDTSNLEDWIKIIDDEQSSIKKNKSISQEIKEDAGYDINHEIPIYEDANLKDNFLKVYKKGQMNSIGHRLIHLFYRSHVPEDDVRQFFNDLQVDHNIDEVDRWIERTYNLDIGHDHIGGLNYFLDGISEYADEDDRDSLLSYFNSYFIKKDKTEEIDLKPFKIGRDEYQSVVTAKLVNGLITDITFKDLIKKESGFNFILTYGKTAKFQVVLNDNVYDFMISYSYNDKGFKFKNKNDLKDIESMLTDDYSVPKWPKSMMNNLTVYLSDLYDYIIETNKPDETEILISSVKASPSDTSNLINLSKFIEDELSIKRTSDKKKPYYYLNTNPNDFNSPTMDYIDANILGTILEKDYNVRLPERNRETVLSCISGRYRINNTSWEFKDGYYLETDNNYQVIGHDPIITSKKLGLKLNDKFYFYEYKPDVKYFNVPEDETLIERTLKQILIPKTASWHIKEDKNDGHRYIIYDNPEDTNLYIDFLQRVGASFNSKNVHKKVTMYLGTGDNGKSLLSYVLKLIFNDFYYGFTPKQLKTDAFTESMASGKNVLIMDELTKDSLNGLWDIVKRYSSGLDNTTKRTMYSDDTDEMSSYGLLYIFTNIIPDMPTDDKAVLRRVDILSLPNIFTDNPTSDNEYPIINDIDIKLSKDIKGLEWLVNASIKAYKGSHKFMASQTDIETLSIIKETDNLFNYLYTNTKLSIGSRTYVSQLLDGFKEYSDEKGHVIKLTDKELRQEIGKKVRQIYSPNDLETNDNGRRWYNIRIKSKDEIEKEMTTKWSVNEYIDFPEEWQVSGIDRTILKLIEDNTAMSIYEIERLHPKVNVETIINKLVDAGYLIEYEIT